MAAVDPAEKSFWFPLANPSLTVHQEGEELVVLNQSGCEIHHLSDSAALVFRFCDGTHSHFDLTEKVLDNYDVDAITAAQDVQRVLAEFHEKNIVQ